MSKGGWARLIKQQQQQQQQLDIDHHNGNVYSKEQQQQQRLIAQLPVNNCCINTSTASTVSTTSASSIIGPVIRGSMLQVAVHYQELIKARKFLQIVRKWRSQSARQMTARRRSSTPMPCSSYCTKLGLMPLSCVTFSSTHSDDEEEEEDDGKECVSDQSRRSMPVRWHVAGAATSQAQARRALSCPRLGSPLGLCTPFPSMARCEDENYEELECFKANIEEESIKLRPSSSSSIRPNNVSKPPSTPKGYLALYVGEERRRFLVKANLLNHPLFGILLEKAKQEFGFDQKGPLNIPCEIAFFQHIMLLVESNDPSYRNADHSSILLHFNTAPNLQAASVM